MIIYTFSPQILSKIAAIGLVSILNYSIKKNVIFLMVKNMKRALNYLWRGWMVLLAGILLILFFIPVYLLSKKKNTINMLIFS